MCPSTSFILPKKMICVYVSQPGPPEVMKISKTDLPVPSTGEVLIKIFAAGVNHADLYQREGVYPPPKDASKIMGLEAAGKIVALGKDVSQEWLGKEVCTLTHGGAYAEYVTAPVALCLPIPSKFSYIEAAALPEAAMTVWNNLFMRGKLASNETLLVHGGTSGIGTTAIQYALSWGCQVIATAGEQRKCEALSAMGVHLAINYKEEDFVSKIKTFTSERGVDVILDIVGGHYTARNIQVLAMDGRLMQIAWLQGNKVTLDLAELSRRRGWITGSFLRPRSTQEKQHIVDELKQFIWPLYSQGKIYPIIDAVFPLQQVIEAHRYLASSQHIGKIILSLEA